MKKLEFKTKIAASAEEVWKIMLDPVTYKKWTNVSWPGSTYKGKWKLGEEIRFEGEGGGGTMAKINEFRPYEYLLAEHVAVINADGSLDRESEIAKGWIGTTESYTFTEKNGQTELKVEMQTSPGWEKMFNDGWSDALKELKRLCEKQGVES